MNLVAVAEEIQHRIIHIFGRDMQGRRATNGGNAKLNFDPHFRDYVWFHEVSCRFFFSVCPLCELYITVLPCRQWQGTWRVAPNWLVRSCCVPYPPEWSWLSFAENSQK